LNNKNITNIKILDKIDKKDLRLALKILIYSMKYNHILNEESKKYIDTLISLCQLKDENKLFDVVSINKFSLKEYIIQMNQNGSRGLLFLFIVSSKILDSKKLEIFLKEYIYKELPFDKKIKEKIRDLTEEYVVLSLKTYDISMTTNNNYQIFFNICSNNIFLQEKLEIIINSKIVKEKNKEIYAKKVKNVLNVAELALSYIPIFGETIQNINKTRKLTGNFLERDKNNKEKFCLVNIKQNKISDTLVIFIDGFMSESILNQFFDWKEGVKNRYKEASLYGYKWASSNLKTIIRGGISSWYESVENTQLSAIKLADEIEKIYDLQSNMRIILMGHSLGARVIFNTLIELHHKNLKIYDVYLFGGAVSRNDKAGWLAGLSSVENFIYNYYSSNDDILSKLYQFSMFAEEPIGLDKIEFYESKCLKLANLKNIDVSLIIGGHTEYKDKLADLLSKNLKEKDCKILKLGEKMSIQELKKEQEYYYSKVKKLEALLSYIDENTDDMLLSKSLNENKYLIRIDGLKNQLKSLDISLSVVAEVSNGKSTFLNALIFKEQILHSGLGAVTARLFKITYGEKHTLNVDNKTTSYPSLDALKDAVKELNLETRNKMDKQNEVSNKDVSEVTITLPHNALKNGITIYDTPGFGALDEKLVYPIIEKSVAKSDAVIMLLDIAQGVKKNEKEFVKTTLKAIQADKRFVIFNKIDAVINEDQIELMGQDEIDAQLSKVQNETLQELSSITGIPKNEIDNYTLSAQKALVGFKQKNQEKIDASYFENFETAFWKKVVTQKSQIIDGRINSYKKLVDENLRNFENITINHQKEEQKIKDLHNANIEKKANISIFTKKSMKELKEASNQFDKESSNLMNINSIFQDIETFLYEVIFEAVEEITWVDKAKVWSLEAKYISKIEEALNENKKSLNDMIDKKITKKINTSMSNLYQSQEKINKTINNINIKIEEFKDIGVQPLKLIKILEKDINGEFHMNNNSDFSNNISIDKDLFVVVGSMIGAAISEIIIARLAVLIPGIGLVISAIVSAVFYFWKKNNNPNEKLAKDISSSIIEKLKGDITIQLDVYNSQLNQIKTSISLSLASATTTLQNIENSFENPQAKKSVLENLTKNIENLNSYTIELNKLKG